MEGKMLVIRHRVNTIEGLKKVDPKYGVEIDIRHDNRNNRLYLNHDSGTGDDFEQYMKVFSEQGNRFVILNVKETGIEQRIIDIVTNLGIKNFFLLDVEFPFIYKATLGKCIPNLNGRIAIRFSEAEPIEQALRLSKKFSKDVKEQPKWVWVDTNTKFPLDKKTYSKLRKSGYKLALVCPERWGRPEDIPKFISHMKKNKIKIDAVMTSADYVEQWEKSGVLKDFV